MSLIQAIARVFVGTPPPSSAASSPRVEALDLTNGLDLGARQEAALKLMDEDCAGFLLLTIHHELVEAGRVDVIAAVRPEWWPALSETLARIVEAVRRGQPE
jgi:hypothetical protein